MRQQLPEEIAPMPMIFRVAVEDGRWVVYTAVKPIWEMEFRFTVPPVSSPDEEPQA